MEKHLDLRLHAMLPKRLITYASVMDTDIMRAKYIDGELSGVIFTFNGGLMTIGHVSHIHRLRGFKSSTQYRDFISYKPDESIKGLPLGLIQDLKIKDCYVIVTTPDNPSNTRIVEGVVDYAWQQNTFFSYFSPYNPKDVSLFDSAGVSGSPIIYKNHIVGAIAAVHILQRQMIFGLVFNRYIEKDMKSIGLSYDTI